jgi:hypothetical protein
MNDALVILWATENKDTFNKLIYLYAKNSMRNDWWKNIKIIIWGPSQQLINDEEVKNKIVELKNVGVEIEVCKWCSDSYNVTEKFEGIDVNPIYMGEPLTKYLKEDVKVMTF